MSIISIILKLVKRDVVPVSNRSRLKLSLMLYWCQSVIVSLTLAKTLLNDKAKAQKLISAEMRSFHSKYTHFILKCTKQLISTQIC